MKYNIPLAIEVTGFLFAVVPTWFWWESILAKAIVFNDGFPPKPRGNDEV